MTIDAKSTYEEHRLDYRWWDADEHGVGDAMTAVAANIERWSYPRRYLNQTCARYMTGRELSSIYAYSTSRRPAGLAKAYGQADWRAPSFNVIATCADVYGARMWKNRPFIQSIPIAGNFKARIRSKKIGRYIDASFADTKLWDIAEDGGYDCATTGDAFAKVDGDAETKKIVITRALADEMLVNEEEAQLGQPRSLLQRVFMHREVAMAKYGDTQEKREAIKRAPGVFAGLYFSGGLNTNDVLALVEGWHLPMPGGGNSMKDAGVHALGVGGVSLYKDKWTRQRFPFSKLPFSRQPTTGYFRQGLAEILLGIQAEIDRIDAAIWESLRRGAWQRWLLDRASNVNVADLAGRAAGHVWYDGGGANPPQCINPAVLPPEVYQKRMQWVTEAFQRARINLQSAQGQIPEGLKSGAAIMSWAALDDSAHVDLGQRFEDWITDIAEQILDVSEEIKPRVRLQGRFVDEINWTDVEMSRSNYSVRAFPLSRLPQLPAARQQTIQNWYDQGKIDKATAMRLEQVPDTQGYLDLVNSSRDAIEMVLDDIVESGEYQPPDFYEDLPLAISLAQSRLLQERTERTPEDRLRLLQHWIMQAEDLNKQNPRPSVGVQAPPGMPAVPASQAAPPQAPQQLPQAA